VGEGQYILLSDTVGFIRKLPHHLVDTFKSTLGVASHAHCILEVVDSTTSDYKEHLEVTHNVLDGLIDKETPRMLVFNKAESADETRRTELLENYPEAFQVSAKENIGMESLLQRLITERNLWKARRQEEKKVILQQPEGWVTQTIA